MKKINLISIIMLLVAAASCERVEVIRPEVSSVYMNASSKTVAVGTEFTLIAYTLPTNANDTTITWSSSAPEVASVRNGHVSAISIGETTLTAAASNGIKAECLLKVVGQFIPVQSVALEKESYEVEPGNTLDVVAVILPENASDKSVSWSVDNDEIAFIYNGTVKGLKLGTTVIRVRTADGTLSASSVLKVTSGKPSMEGNGSTEALGTITDYKW